ncbi:acyl-coenzyme A thioesterase 13-like [Salvia divinorum]|uniref:Acyl-coenzyme A thioesterase 13 n=1 Tax=Salvia divinorum TaxID=28513 RepID=A0ABD1GLZ7_SALDI
MEKAREFLEKYTTGEAADEVSRLSLPPHRPLDESSFYECFGGRGVRLDLLHSDFITCSFRVPPRLLGGDGNLTMGAISTLVDLLGAAVAYQGDDSWNVSADMSISYISPAKLDDELEILARCLGRRGGYSGTHVLIRNKITGAVVAEGRHSLFDARSNL